MKKLLAILMVLVISVMAIPVLVSADSGTLYLVCKNPDTWARVNDATYGTLIYNTSGPTFDFSFTATGLADGDYSLIYYANPYPGDHPGALLGVGTATGGSLTIVGSPDLNMDLPTAPDANMIMDYNVPPNDLTDNTHGAKIWLVPSDCYNGVNMVTSWQPTRFLFETDLINYVDTDKTVGTEVVGLTTTVTEPTSQLSFTVDPVSLPFGDVAINSCSGSHTITIYNTGNVPINVTGTPSTGFYASCLKLGVIGAEYLSPSGWETGEIAVGGSHTFSAIVCPLPGLSGIQTGTLTFMAEYAP